MASELRENRKNPDRKIMIGVMAHPLTLHPDTGRGDPDCDGVRDVFPTREELAGGFTDDPDVVNTIHYADLYGPHPGQNVLENLELCVQYGGENLHAIQLDLTWPKPDELAQFKERNPHIRIILQVGEFALKEVNSDPDEVVNRLRAYGDSIDHVLLDTSMGRGKGIEAAGLLPILRLIREQLPDLGLVVAGGFGPESLDSLEPIAREFPDVSIDAQGNVKSKDAPRDALGHLVSTHPADLERSTSYIKQSCAMLDSPMQEQ